MTTKKLQNFVNGKKTDSATTRFQSVFNPALGVENVGNQTGRTL